ncbi:MAG: DUF4097 family beta strand repeat protein [Bacteroidetes bacterium]|nr:DUF4097 family beta strand repeat protein [Bacteroidota bacterium]
MKKNLILSLLVFAALATRAQSGTPYMTKSFAGESVKEVEAKTQGGSISVAGNAGETRVEVYVSPNNGREFSVSKDEIQKRLSEDYDLSVTVSGGKISAIAKTKEKNMNWKRALSISFKIFVPQNVSTDLSTSGGSINLSNLSGTQYFRTSGGSLTVERVSGKINGGTSGGSIDVSDSKDDIDLHTSGGSIVAENCTGKIKLNTSGGSLRLRGLNGTVRATTSGGSVDGKNVMGELVAHTSGGNVDLREMSCSLDASTSGGNIAVDIKELGEYVTISNSSGHVDLELPKNKGLNLNLNANKIKTDPLNNFSGSMEENQLRGKLNGGGVPVTVDAGSGRINLTFK